MNIGQETASDYFDFVLEQKRHPLTERARRKDPKDVECLALFFLSLSLCAAAPYQAQSMDVTAPALAVRSALLENSWLRVAGFEFLLELGLDSKVQEYLEELLGQKSL